MLTARGDTLDRVLGLEMGADDYLAKPFDPSELVARIRAILRRANTPSAAAAETMGAAGIELEPGTRSARCDGRRVELTTVEFDLLMALVRAAGRTVAREELVRGVLGRAFSAFDRSVDTHICNLRKKLGRLEDGSERIKSVRGSGYMLAAWHGSHARR
jgi:two-component system response regulator CpxR